MPTRRSTRSAAFVLLLALAMMSGPALADEEVVQGHDYDVTVTSAGAATAGKPAEITVVLTTYSGRKVNAEFPISLRVVAPADVDVPRAKLERGDAHEVGAQRAEFRFAVTPKTAGDKPLTLTFRFATCTSTQCESSKETIAFKLRTR